MKRATVIAILSGLMLSGCVMGTETLVDAETDAVTEAVTEAETENPDFVLTKERLRYIRSCVIQMGISEDMISSRIECAGYKKVPLMENGRQYGEKEDKSTVLFRVYLNDSPNHWTMVACPAGDGGT